MYRIMNASIYDCMYMIIESHAKVLYLHTMGLVIRLHRYSLLFCKYGISYFDYIDSITGIDLGYVAVKISYDKKLMHCGSASPSIN